MNNTNQLTVNSEATSAFTVITKLSRKEKKVFREFARTFITKVDRHGDLYLQKSYSKCSRRGAVVAPPFNKLWNNLRQRGLSDSEVQDLYGDIAL